MRRTSSSSRSPSSASDSESGSGSDSGSDSDSESSSGRSESATERATILGNSFRLPRELCENADIFREFLTIRVWNELSEADRRSLRRFLPDFPENDAEEKEITVQKLFACEPFKFGSPLVDFHRRLRSGAFKPTTVRLRRAAASARYRHALAARRRRLKKCFATTLAAREAALDAAPGVTPSLPEHNRDRILERTRRRYFRELASVRNAVYGENAITSEDDIFPMGPPPPLSSRYYRYINKLQEDDTMVISTLGCGIHLSNGIVCLNEDWKKKALFMHKKRKENCPNHIELMTNGITFNSIKSRIGNKFVKDNIEKRAHIVKSRHLHSAPCVKPKLPSSPSNSEFEDSGKTSIMNFAINGDKQLSSNDASMTSSHLPMSPPIKVEHIKQESSVLDEEVALQLVQSTHACFLSVIRDLVCSTPQHCLPLHTLELRLHNWRQNPITALNHWYTSIEDWEKALPSAISFLTGENGPQSDDFVPYLQYKPSTQVYQWIGAGRDSDALLMPLCEQWLSQRQTETIINPVASPVIVPVETNQIQTPPTINTKWNNHWQISAKELESFRAQEMARFQRPHRAFTYNLPHGKIVVGPLKGVYGVDESGTLNNRGARGHTLLMPTRPRHVTLLALVRDAVACLPGGEGTRAHITALLRRSQYLVPNAGEQALQAAVSGALDRMHGAPDPCVQFLPARKLWIYLHKDRTEEEFERLHAETQMQNKNKASVSVLQKRSLPSKPKAQKSVKMIKSTSLIEHTTEKNIKTDDVNVDVENSESNTFSMNADSSSASLSSIISSGHTLEKIIKQNGNGEPQSSVRILSSISAHGKSLINPHALDKSSRSDTNLQTLGPETKLIVQRSPNYSSGTLSQVQQKRLLESLLIKQPISSDSLLQGTNTVQKIQVSSTSNIVPPSKLSNKPSTSINSNVLTGQTLQLSSGKTVQLTGQAVQLSNQAVHFGGQTVQIGGQTVQITGQSLQLIGQSQASVQSLARKQSSPVITKILTSNANNQIKNSRTLTAGNPTNNIRLASIAQLQGKPILLHSSTSSGKTSNIILQTAGTFGNNVISMNNAAEQSSSSHHSASNPTQQTLLLSNLSGQVVRVAGTGTLLAGSNLRLQTPVTAANTGVLVDANALKFQTATKLNQGVTSATPNRVLVTSGTRLHGLKLLPVHHPLAKGASGSGKPLFARIVNTNMKSANLQTPGLVVSTRAVPVTTVSSDVVPLNTMPHKS